MIERRSTGPIARSRVSTERPGASPESRGLARAAPAIARAAPIGVFIGAIPGLGSAISAYLNYGIARALSRRPERFGKGAIEGVAAAEAGNNAVTGSTFIPMLTLGIPGDVITAIMLGAFMVHGLVPGPQLFRDHARLRRCVLRPHAGHDAAAPDHRPHRPGAFIQAVRVPNQVLFPIVLALSFTGVYVATNNLFDVGVMLGFGVLGYAMNKFGFPVAPLLIGFILGPIVEVGLRQSLIIGRGDLSVFVRQPISAVFLALGLAALVWAGYRELRGGAARSAS